MRQGYDWDEQSLRPIPSLDTDGESLVEEAEAGSTRVVTATFLMDDFSPSLYYKAELFRDGIATGDHCFVSTDKRHSKLGYADENSTANCSVIESTSSEGAEQIAVSFEGLTQIEGTYTVRLKGCMRDASNTAQCGKSGSPGTKWVSMEAPS